jgi:hypothetical protein
VIKHASNLFLLFLHHLLSLCHRLLPMSNGNYLPADVLLRLDVGLAMGLHHSIQLFGACHQLLDIGIK